jgi:hypothetical protein
MRLLDTKTLELHEFLGDTESKEFPRYAILSHTWGEEECSLREMSLPEVTQRAGFRKIKYCCEQAVKDGLQWVWVDTCCIDKTSTAELSEAINSMFRWYRQSAVCYVYLADVEHVIDTEDAGKLAHSRWLTRGWTLQELIAPRKVRFYDRSWCLIGSKSERDIRECLTAATGIEASILLGGQLEYVPIARKMSWAAGRSTTRVEDAAYCLLGIFDVNMPLLYGEGKKAFIRLQQEIMKVSDDHSLFAWGLEEQPATLEAFEEMAWSTTFKPSRGLLAESAADFKVCRGIHPIHNLQSDVPPVFTDNGLQIRLPIVRKAGISCAAISCTVDQHLNYYLAIPLISWGSRYMARCAPPVLVRSDLVKEKSLQTVLVKRASDIPPPKARPGFLEIHTVPQKRLYYDHYTKSIGPSSAHHGEIQPFQYIGELLLPQHATRSKDDMITLDNIDQRTDVPHAALVIRGIHYWGLVFGGALERRDGIWCAVLPLLKEDEQIQNGQDVPIPSLLREHYHHKLIVADPKWYITQQELQNRLLMDKKTWASLPSMPVINGQRSRIHLGRSEPLPLLEIETWLIIDFQFKPLDLLSSGHRVVVSLESEVNNPTYSM